MAEKNEGQSQKSTTEKKIEQRDNAGEQGASSMNQPQPSGGDSGSNSGNGTSGGGQGGA